MSAARAPRRGFTLVEVIVAIAVLGVTLGVAGLAATGWSAVSEDDEWRSRLLHAESLAAREGRVVVVWPDSAHSTPPALRLPDGRRLGHEHRRDGGER